MNFLIDTHTHLDCMAFSNDYDDVIKRCMNLGVTKIMLIGVRRSDWQRKLDMVEKYKSILYPILGCHPLFIKDHSKSDIFMLEKYLKNTPITAIGEIGLDYYNNPSNKSDQQWYFEAQLELAQKYNLPIVLHVRKAHDQVIKTLKKFKIIGGIVHAFNGSIQHAKKYIELNFCLAAGGMLTHPHSNKLHNLFKQIEIEHIVLETDSPDLTVFSHRGERNSPEYLPEVSRSLADIKDMDNKDIINITTNNAIRCLGIGTD